jgi:hypothetical protein
MLWLSGNAPAAADIAMLLSKTPALRYLTLGLSQYGPATTTQCIRIDVGFESPLTYAVPYLEQYTGPHELLPVVLGRAAESPSAHLRRLVLNCTTETGNTLDAFLNTLKSCQPLQLRGITHLRISFLKSMDLKSLTIIQDMFPVLQEFTYMLQHPTFWEVCRWLS